MNLDVLLDFAYRRAEDYMAMTGEFYVLVHGIARNGDHVIIMPHPSISDSEQRGKLIQLAFVGYDITAYAAISEAWMLRCERDQFPEVRPSQSERRVEVLVAVASDGDNRKLIIREIRRNADGSYAGTQPEATDQGVDAIGGVLSTLLPIAPVSKLKRRMAREAIGKLNKQIKIIVLSAEDAPIH